MNEHELVKECLGQVFQLNGYSAIPVLTQRDYEYISEKVAQKTGILISISTLKRLHKGEFSRLPQVATLNALANFLDYQNWQDFRSQYHSTSIVPQSARTKPKHKHLFRRVLYSVLILLVLLLFVITWTSLKSPPLKSEDVHFSYRKVTSNDIPNTVVRK